MTYLFKYRRRLFWKTHRVSGHVYTSDQDKLVLYFQDGSVQEVKDWKNCELRLGTDWVAAQKKMLESQTGQSIPLGVGNA